MKNGMRYALFLLAFAFLAGLVLFAYHVTRETPDSMTAGTAPRPNPTEPPPPAFADKILPATASTPVASDLLDHARLHLRITGVAEPLDLEPPPAAQFDPAPLNPLEAARRVASACKAGGTDLTADMAPGHWQLQFGTVAPGVVQETLDLAIGVTERTCDATQYPGLAGRVVDERGAALKDVRVLVMPLSSVRGGWPNSAGQAQGTTASGDGQLVARTRNDGTFTLPFLPADEFYVLEASAPNRLVVRRDPFGLESARLQQLPDIVLAKGRAISGIVVSEAGTPVQNCDIHGIAPDPRRSLRTSTDAGGRFRFENLSNNAVSIWTETRLGINTGEEVTAPGDVEVKFVLRDGAWIEGTATFEDGSPAAGLSLGGYPHQRAGTLNVGEDKAGYQDATTAKDGSFRLGPFSPGLVRVTEQIMSFLDEEVTAPGVVHLTVPGQQPWDVTLRLHDETGEPIDQAGRLTMQWGRGDLVTTGTRDITPNAQGLLPFTWHTPASTNLQLTFTFPGCERAIVPDLAAAVAAAAAQPVDVTIRKEQAFRVQVVNASGQPVAGASVRLLWATDKAGVRENIMQPRPGVYEANLDPFPGRPALSEMVEADASGAVSFHRLGAGPVAWMVTAAGFLPASGQRDQLDPAKSNAADLVIKLQAATVATAH